MSTVKERKRLVLERALAKEARKNNDAKTVEDDSLVAQKMAIDEYAGEVNEEARALQAELAFLERLEESAKQPMRAVHELAKQSGKELYIDDGRQLLGWKMPSKYTQLTNDQIGVLVMNEAIVIEDDYDAHAKWVPVVNFKHFRFRKHLLAWLESNDIRKPSAIQQAALPVALSGRDLLAVAGTGSGKTLVYLIPLAYQCILRELSSPLFQRQSSSSSSSRGPFALVLTPSRELAAQIADTLVHILDALQRDFRLTTALIVHTVIGGVKLYPQIERLERGCHALVATPGRLKDLLDRKVCALDSVIVFVLDEADRLFDFGFEDTVRDIVDRLKPPLQTMLFSATMPAKVKSFGRSSLKSPVLVHAGKAGRANKNVKQRVNIIAAHRRLKFLMEELQLTGPPVVIFSSNKGDVDEIHEFLLERGVDAAAVHGGLSQQEREEAVNTFRKGQRDVLIGTDVASKGLDFPHVKHVINYDMPEEIENYIHRIGRTGRRGSSGLASTFVHTVFNETVLLDLRAILLEAGQPVPRFLNMLAKARGYPEGHIECAYCGGPGHRVMQCPKLESQRLKHARLVGERHLKTEAEQLSWY